MFPDLYDSSSVPSSSSPSFHSNLVVELDITTEIHTSANLDLLVDTTVDIDPITIPENTIPYFSPSPIPPPFDPPILRKSTGPYHPPAYLLDYSCISVNTKLAPGLPYDILDGLSYFHLGPTFQSFVMTIIATPSKLVFFH